MCGRSIVTCDCCARAQSSETAAAPDEAKGGHEASRRLRARLYLSRAAPPAACWASQRHYSSRGMESKSGSRRRRDAMSAL